MSTRGAGGVHVGMRAVQRHVVREVDTAVALGSGDLAVLATPRLLAWCEAAACAAVDGVLPAACTSVGTRVSLEHLAPAAVGSVVAVEAEVQHVDGRLVRFAVAARLTDGPGAEAPGAVLATGTTTRVVVDRDRFVARLEGGSGGQSSSA